MDGSNVSARSSKESEAVISGKRTTDAKWLVDQNRKESNLRRRVEFILGDNGGIGSDAAV